MSGYGSSYLSSWWGDVNAPNGWGWIYPFNAEGSTVKASSTLFSSDNTQITSDNGVASGSVAFTCSDTVFSVSTGVVGQTVNGSVSVGVLQSVSPTTYQSGSNTYTGTISTPSGYTNTGSNISCTTTATGNSGLPSSPGTLNTTKWQIMASFDSTAITYVYNSVTYSGGFTDTLSVLRNLDGVTFSSGIGSNFVQFDAVSPIVGTYVADGFDNFLSSSSMGNFGQYAAFSTPKYMRVAANVPLGSAGGFSNPFDAFPIYKVEQANGYLQITEIITS